MAVSMPSTPLEAGKETCSSTNGSYSSESNSCFDITPTPRNSTMSTSTITNLSESHSPPPTKAPIENTTSTTSIDSSDNNDTIPDPSNDERRQKLEKHLVRKLDICLLPVLIGMCMGQGIDRATITIAKIDGIEDSLHMTQRQYNFALSIFYIGYNLFQVPSNMLICKVHPGVYLSSSCLLWSVSGLGHAFVRNRGQLLCARFLLGVCEAPFFVGALHLLSCWYRKRELGVRMAILLVSLIVTYTILNPISAVILEELGGKNGWEGWRWVYFIFGLVGVVNAAIGFLMLPGYPGLGARKGFWRGRSTWWLSRAEEELARSRIGEERVNAKTIEKQKVWIGLKDALKDVKMWIFAVMMFSRKSFDGLWFYELPLLKSFRLVSPQKSGLSENTLALLLGIGPSGLAVIAALAGARSSDQRSERTWHIVIPLLFAGMALIISSATLNSIVRYTAMFFWEAGALAGIAMTWSWISTTIQETAEKQAAAIALVNVLGGFGAIAGPFLFRKRDAPGYRMAFGVLAGLTIVDIACVFGIRSSLKKSNRSLETRTDNNGRIKTYDL